jgi:plastocyanin
MSFFKTAILSGLVLSAATLMAAPPSGGVTGKVPLPARSQGRIAVEKYTGTISGKVAKPAPPQAGVWIEGPGVAAPRPAANLVMGQEGYQFSQSLMVVPRGSTVAFPNHDNDYHNIFSLSRGNRFDINRYKKGETPVPVVAFKNSGFVRLACEIHDHMKAAILVVDSPWHGVTDATGKFTLKGIPAGTYTLRAQLDEKTQWSVPVVIIAGKTITADFNQKPALP